jgi:hypothetical protein
MSDQSFRRLVPPAQKTAIMILEKFMRLSVDSVDASVSADNAKAHGHLLQQKIIVQFRIDKSLAWIWKVHDM